MMVSNSATGADIIECLERLTDQGFLLTPAYADLGPGDHPAVADGVPATLIFEHGGRVRIEFIVDPAGWVG